MKKQALAIAIASALVAPSAFAAQDTSGMQYTSAAEGFYASIRAQVDFSNGNNDANINGGSSRVGIRGTNDLGGGLEGFYQWEVEVGIDDGTPDSGNDSEIHTRLGHVGLRGAFGEVVAGSFWTNDYFWTHGSTDIANVYSGYLNYSNVREARSERSIQYTTPDLNGFQGAFLVGVGNSDNDADGDNGNDLDSWNLSAQYAIQGFTVAGSYNVITDGQVASGSNDPSTCAVSITSPISVPVTLPSVFTELGEADCNTLNQTISIPNAGGTIPVSIAGNFEAADDSRAYEDLTSWTIRLGYAQDNWYVNGWYGEDDSSESDGKADAELFSVAGGVEVDRVNVYVLYEAMENANGGEVGVEDSYGTLGVQYTLGSNSRVWIEYWSRDLGNTAANPNRNEENDDIINIGLRHDF